MSNEKWTPGSWEVTHEAGFDDYVGVAMGTAIEDPGCYTTSHLWFCEVEAGEGDDEAEANAHLIAAAPDLYEALNDIVTSWDVSADKSLLSQEIEYARRQLAKARGE